MARRSLVAIRDVNLGEIRDARTVVAQRLPAVLLQVAQRLPDVNAPSAGPATSLGSSLSPYRRRNAPGTRHAMRVVTPAIRGTPVTPEPAAIPRGPADRGPANATPTGSPSTVVVPGIAPACPPGRRESAVPPAHPGGSGSGPCGSSVSCWS